MNTPRDDRCAMLYHAIVAHKQKHDGVSLGLRELSKRTGISSTSVVSYHLTHLEEDSLIIKPYATARSIEVAGASWVPYDVRTLVDALEAIAEDPCCEEWGCCPEDPQCIPMLARAALQEVGLR